LKDGLTSKKSANALFLFSKYAKLPKRKAIKKHETKLGEKYPEQYQNRIE